MATPLPPDSTLEEDRALVLDSIRVPPNRAAQQTLFARYDERLIRFFRYRAGPSDFEDLRQQVWVALLGTDPERIKTLNTSVRAFLYGIARNVLYGYYRQCKRTFDPLTSSLEVFDLTLSRQVAKMRGAATLHEALQELPIDEQILLDLRYFEEMSTLELAETYQIPVGTIKSRLFAARKLLDAHMKPKSS